jgi:hypothetical protein
MNFYFSLSGVGFSVKKYFISIGIVFAILGKLHQRATYYGKFIAFLFYEIRKSLLTTWLYIFKSLKF